MLYADMPATKQPFTKQTEPPHADRHSRAEQKVLDVGGICQRRAHHSDRTGSNRTWDSLRTIVPAEISDNSHPGKYSAFQRSLPPVQALSACNSGKGEWGRIVVGVADKDVTAGRNLCVGCYRKKQAHDGDCRYSA